MLAIGFDVFILELFEVLSKGKLLRKTTMVKMLLNHLENAQLIIPIWLYCIILYLYFTCSFCDFFNV